jgi:hypothetical protein
MRFFWLASRGFANGGTSMRRNTALAVVGLLAVARLAAFALGLSVSAQAGGFHVLPVTSGGVTCRDMTDNLRSERDTWRTFYFNYMAGFITGANFVSYSVGNRDSNLPSEPHDAVFASIEQYCAGNPARNISEAVVRVYSQLIAR